MKVNANKCSVRSKIIRLPVITMLFFLAACSKDGTPPMEDASTAQLRSLSISQERNPSMSGEPFIQRGQENIFYVTVPLGTDLSGVHMAFDIDEGAKITVQGVSLVGNSGTFNAAQTLEAEVTGSVGGALYRILVQEGISDIDRLVYTFKETYSIPGVSIAISRTQHSDVVYKTGLGFSITEENVRTQPNHLFRLASISKQFTSICIMKLMEEGLLSLEDTVFGEGGILASSFSGVTERGSQVTVRHLLEHTSGWTSSPDPMFSSTFDGQTLDQRISHVLMSEQGIPGRQHSYFNMGYGILGKIIEQVSGKEFEAYMKEVLSEAGIDDIHVGGNRQQRRQNEVVYYSQDGRNGYGNDMQVIKAAGGVIASTEQMLALLQYIDGRDNIPDILRADTRETMLTASEVTNRYALGWRMGHNFFPGSWYHGGNLAGTAVLWVMGPNINAVILCNSRSYIPGFDDNLFYLMRDIIQFASQRDW